MPFRLDIGTLGNAERTPQGGLKVPAYLTRSGVFDYHTDDGKIIREYRPPEEVFKADTLGTLPNAPVTNDHPPEHVYPANFKRYAVGHVAGEAKQDGDKVSAPLIVQDEAAIRSISNGRREVSCGYHCDVEEKPGLTPEGLPYDRVQRNIKYNHVAIVDDGRAGSQVRLRLDSKGNSFRHDGTEPTIKEKPTMDFEIIGGVKYEAGSEPHADAVKRRDAAEKKAHAELGELKARCDSAEAQLAQAKAAVAQASDPARFDRAVKVRQAIVTKATAILGKNFKADGLSNLEIKKAVIAKVLPSTRLDTLAARIPNEAEQRGYINGAFRLAIATPAGTRMDSAPRTTGQVPTHLLTPPPEIRIDDASAPSSMDALRRRRNDELEGRHRQPLMVSKSNPMKAVDGFPALQSSMLETMK